MKQIMVIIALACAAANGMAQQALSREEQQIVEVVNRNLPRNLILLQQLVNINSGTLNVAGVKKTGTVLQEAFDGIGFSTEWVNLPDSLKRAGHLVAYIKSSHKKKGGKGKRIFLIGHLDTVFEPDMPANPWHLLNDSTVTGQGVNDMKGGDVVIFAALQALQQANLLKDATITAYFTGDEENSGKPETISRKDFIERARQHDVALGYEAAQGLNTVAIARRGSSNWQLKVYGVQAHSSGVFKVGDGSIYEAARILNAFREQLSNEPYLTFNPGLIAGGSDVQYDSAAIQARVAGKTNIIAPFTAVQGDLRFLRESQKDSARQRMLLIATTDNLLQTRAEFTYSDGIPSMEPTPGNMELVRKLNDVSMALGIGKTQAGDPGSRGAGDISFVAKYLDCIDGLGVTGKGSHAPGETMNLNDFGKMVQRTAVLIYRLMRGL